MWFPVDCEQSDWSVESWSMMTSDNIVWEAYRVYVRGGLKRMVISWCSHFCFINNTRENKVDLTHLLWLKMPC